MLHMLHPITILPKHDANHSTIPGEIIHVDISYTLAKIMGGDKYWDLMVDQETRYKYSEFLKTTDQMSNSMY